jgi:hypothetical protein
MCLSRSPGAQRFPREVKVTIDNVFLGMANAGIDGRNIVWTFHPIERGDTQVVVTIHGGEATFIIQKTYDVHIFSFDETSRTSSVQVVEGKWVEKLRGHSDYENSCVGGFRLGFGLFVTHCAEVWMFVFDWLGWLCFFHNV